jgi:hypothetical protein
MQSCVLCYRRTSHRNATPYPSLPPQTPNTLKVDERSSEHASIEIDKVHTSIFSRPITQVFRSEAPVILTASGFHIFQFSNFIFGLHATVSVFFESCMTSYRTVWQRHCIERASRPTDSAQQNFTESHNSRTRRRKSLNVLASWSQHHAIYHTRFGYDIRTFLLLAFFFSRLQACPLVDVLG